MSDVLLPLIRAARGAGIRISMAETLDAMHAAATVGWADRAVLRDALTLCLAKSHDEQALFATTFDLYFHGESQAPSPIEADPAETEASPLAQMLLAGDAAGLATAMQAAAEATEATQIALFTQTNLFARRILDRMGLEALDRAIAAPALNADTRTILEQGRANIATQARAYMERQLALFGAATTRETREHALRRIALSQLDRRDIARMQTLIRAMARRLATRHGVRRRRAERGRLDVARTLHVNAGTGGIPFHTVWKHHRIDRPKVLALCDVSGSVANVSRFLLFFLYTMADLLSDIRCFAFSSHSIEITDLLDHQDIEPAIAEVLARIGYGSSDYGRSLAGFADLSRAKIDRRTTVVILGDARGNRAPPRADILQDLQARAGRVLWLNPEPESLWGTGDSDMPRYAPHCTSVISCNTVARLERAMDLLLQPPR